MQEKDIINEFNDSLKSNIIFPELWSYYKTNDQRNPVHILFETGGFNELEDDYILNYEEDGICYVNKGHLKLDYEEIGQFTNINSAMKFVEKIWYSDFLNLLKTVSKSEKARFLMEKYIQ